MAKNFADEHVLGHVASESEYDPSWEPPTIFDLWNLLEEFQINEFAFTPFGKLGSDKRLFGSTTVIKQKDDVLAVLQQLADETGVDRSIIFVDPTYSARFTEIFCNFQSNTIVHLTGWGIKAIR